MGMKERERECFCDRNYANGLFSFADTWQARAVVTISLVIYRYTCGR